MCILGSGKLVAWILSSENYKSKTTFSSKQVRKIIKTGAQVSKIESRKTMEKVNKTKASSLKRSIKLIDL
jgi:hypothetical protein